MGCGASKDHNVAAAIHATKERDISKDKSPTTTAARGQQLDTLETGRLDNVKYNAKTNGQQTLSETNRNQKCLDSQDLIPEEDTENGEFMSNPNQNPPVDILETPNILFFFDFQAKIFYHFNTHSLEWSCNDLTRSMDNCPRCPLLKFNTSGEESEAVQFSKYMSGYNTFYSCLEYNISENTFLVKKPLKAFRNNPSLCKYGKSIFAVSGDLLDSFSYDVNKYDVERDEWTIMPDLPSPQGFAAVRVIYENTDRHQPDQINSSESLKLAVLGGMSKKFPKTYTPLLSLFNLNENKWIIYDLNKLFGQRIPRFIHSSMIQRSEGDLLILGVEGSKSIYRFDVTNLRMVTSGKLQDEDNFSSAGRSKEMVYRNNQVFCLSHKQDMKVYLGYLSIGKWEILE